MTSRRTPRRHRALGRAPLAIAAALLSALGTSAAAPAAARQRAAATKPTPHVRAVAAGFGRPFTIAPAALRDLTPALLAFAPSDAAAAAFGAAPEDDTTRSAGLLSAQALNGVFAPPRTVPGTQQVLSLAYRGSELVLLTGSSVGQNPCCSRARTVAASGSFGTGHTVITGLAGPALGRLVTTGDRLLAAVATEHGVWAAQSDTRGHFGPTVSLAPATSWPQSLDAAALAGGRTVIAWTSLPSQFAPGPTQIFVATGSAAAVPRLASAAVTVPAGHQINELAVAAHGRVPTVAWIESWFDAAGTFHSRAYAADLAGRRTPQAVSAADQLASGLSLAAGAGGGQLLAYRGCDRAGRCVARAALRRRGRFGAAQALGTIDPSQSPTATMSAAGYGLVGWIAPAGVRTAIAPVASATLRTPARLVAVTPYAADLTAAFTPSGTSAILAWTQGTRNQSIVAAAYGVPGKRR